MIFHGPSWHHRDEGYLDLRSTANDNQVGVDHVHQYFTSDLAKCRFIWKAHVSAWPPRPGRLLKKIRLRFSTLPAPEHSSVWMN